MAQTNINIRIDEDVKRDFETFCNNIGLTVSAAFNIFARTVIRQQKIPFELALEQPNETTLNAMAAAEKNGDIYGPFDSVKDLMEALNA